MTPRRRDLIVLVGIIVLAAGLRLAGLPDRGRWDDDQGAHLLAVRAWVVDGDVPLLGPSSSIGGVHHGALYYWLLAPGAALTDTDPTAAVLTILAVSLIGVAATWGLGRTIGGPAAGHAAGLLAACSPAAIEAATFVWNPNIVAPGAALALLGAWRSWTTGDARWWILAAVGIVVAVQGHLLAGILVPPLLALLVLDWRRRSAGAARRSLGWASLAALGILVVGSAPLIAHELGSGFSETRAFVDVLTGASAIEDGGEGAALPARLLIVPWRTLAWPLAGLVTNAPVLALLTAIGVAVVAGWRLAAGQDGERAFVGWSVGTLVWSVAALAVLAPGLSTVVVGLPTDHYHAFLDPLVLTVAALGVAALWRLDREGAGGTGRVAAAALLAAAVAVGIPAWPPLADPDGGWPAAETTAADVLSALDGRTAAVVPLPDVKTGDAVRFPLVRSGAALAPPDRAEALVVVCDPLFESLLDAPCGGAAEDRAVPGTARLLERIDGGPRRVVSVYALD